jgi:phosphatidylserine/phosphatidylglycerophosphate/cardiolipin synthase-like enzyme
MATKKATTPLETPMHGIRDNHSRGSVADFLRLRLSEGSMLSVVSAYFTIHAYHALKEELDGIDRLKFLFGEPRFIGSLDPEKTERKRFSIEDDGLELANRLQQRKVAYDCARWLEEKVDVRSVLDANFVHGKMFHIDDGRREHAIVGSSNFTRRGLGLSSASNIELNLIVDSDRDRSDLKAWFDAIWDDKALVSDVKEEVLRYLEQLYVNRWIHISSATPELRAKASSGVR